MGCHALLQGIFPPQESNLGLLHCRQPLYVGLQRALRGAVAMAGVSRPSTLVGWTGAARHSRSVSATQHGTLGSGRSSDKGPSWSSRSLGAREVRFLCAWLGGARHPWEAQSSPRVARESWG